MANGLGSVAVLTGLLGTTVVVGVGLKSIELINEQSKNIIKPKRLRKSKQVKVGL